MTTIIKILEWIYFVSLFGVGWVIYGVFIKPYVKGFINAWRDDKKENEAKIEEKAIAWLEKSANQEKAKELGIKSIALLKDGNVLKEINFESENPTT